MRRLILLFTMLPALATAEIYRWTDAQGQVHFSAVPVSGAQSVSVTPQVVEGAPDAATRTQHLEQLHSARREERQAEDKRRAGAQAALARTCAQARSDHAQLLRGGRFYHEEEGKRVFWSDAQIEAEKQRLERLLKDRQCSDE